MAGKNNKRYKIRKEMNKIKHEPKRLFSEPPVLISTWEELAKVESQTHYIEMDKDGWSGHVRPKDETKVTEDNWYDHYVYLSTHTFYGHQYFYSTVTLRNLGFNIQLKNWDGETIYCPR